MKQWSPFPNVHVSFLWTDSIVLSVHEFYMALVCIYTDIQYMSLPIHKDSSIIQYTQIYTYSYHDTRYNSLQSLCAVLHMAWHVFKYFHTSFEQIHVCQNRKLHPQTSTINKDWWTWFKHQFWLHVSQFEALESQLRTGVISYHHMRLPSILTNRKSDLRIAWMPQAFGDSMILDKKPEWKMHRWMEIENASRGELFIALNYLLKCTNLQILNCLEWYQPINQTYTGSIRWDPAIWSIKRIESWWGIQTLHPEMLQWPVEIAQLHICISHLSCHIISLGWGHVGTLFLPDLMIISTRLVSYHIYQISFFRQHHRCFLF